MDTNWEVPQEIIAHIQETKLKIQRLLENTLNTKNLNKYELVFQTSLLENDKLLYKLELFRYKSSIVEMKPLNKLTQELQKSIENINELENDTSQIKYLLDLIKDVNERELTFNLSTNLTTP